MQISAEMSGDGVLVGVIFVGSMAVLVALLVLIERRRRSTLDELAFDHAAIDATADELGDVGDATDQIVVVDGRHADGEKVTDLTLTGIDIQAILAEWAETERGRNPPEE